MGLPPKARWRSKTHERGADGASPQEREGYQVREEGKGREQRQKGSWLLPHHPQLLHPSCSTPAAPPPSPVCSLSTDQQQPQSLHPHLLRARAEMGGFQSDRGEREGEAASPTSGASEVSPAVTVAITVISSSFLSFWPWVPVWSHCPGSSSLPGSFRLMSLCLSLLCTSTILPAAESTEH